MAEKHSDEFRRLHDKLMELRHRDVDPDASQQQQLELNKDIRDLGDEILGSDALGDGEFGRLCDEFNLVRHLVKKDGEIGRAERQRKTIAHVGANS